MTDASMQKLESDEFPYFPTKHGRLNRKTTEVPQRISEKKIEEVDAKVRDQQPFDHRGDL